MEEAKPNALSRLIEGVEVPYLNLETLIRSKSTPPTRTDWMWNGCASYKEAQRPICELGWIA